MQAKSDLQQILQGEGVALTPNEANPDTTTSEEVPVQNWMPSKYKSLLDDSRKTLTSPTMALYPYYAVNADPNSHYPIVFPVQERKTAAIKKFTMKLPSAYEHGVVYYVYSNDICIQGTKYIKEALIYSKRLKEMSPQSKVALVTNCDLPLELFSFLDVVIPIHPNDIMHLETFQFQTRVLYNIDPPFDYSLVMDAHVLFCQNDDLEEAFSLFMQSTVDLAYSTRVLNSYITSGFAVMYRRSPVTRQYWTDVTMRMNDETSSFDDQYPMNEVTIKMRQAGQLNFRWLSNNWFYATHGVSTTGQFLGKSNCYRSSVLINGRIRFIHGGANQCVLVNGNNNQYGPKLRTVYIPGTECPDIYKNSKLVQSQEEFASVIGVNLPPAFDWHLLDKEDSNGLFWYEDK